MKDSKEVSSTQPNHQSAHNVDENISYYDNTSFTARSKNIDTDITNDVYFTVEKSADVSSQVNGFDTSWMILDGKKYADSSSENDSIDIDAYSSKITKDNDVLQCFSCNYYRKLPRYPIICTFIVALIIVACVAIYYTWMDKSRSMIEKRNETGKNDK